jgi:hypothetical protein
MITVDIALELRRAGLAWQPAERDCFAIPGEEFAGQIFSLNSVLTTIELLGTSPAITFRGSSEWALDYLLTSDAVWIPTETQLRTRLAHLIGPDVPLTLERGQSSYRVSAGPHTAEAPEAEHAYALALLAVLRQRSDMV